MLFHPRKARGWRIVLAFTLSVGTARAAAPDLSETFFNSSGTVILFLGDSITRNGGYINELKARLLQRYPGMKAKFVNAGISGENMTKLMARVDGVLAAEKPDLVFSSYGMNDGGYNPMSDTRFKAYRDNNTALLARVAKAGAPLILMTSTPFDSLTAAPMIVDNPPYKFKAFYRNFDSVLTAYGDWLKTLRSSDQVVIDLQTPVKTWAKEQRVKNPKYAWTSDGVHPNAEAHKIIGQAIYAALFTPTAIAARENARLRQQPAFSSALRGYSVAGAFIEAGSCYGCLVLPSAGR
jgi:lysophospholipase L1-like esterase